MDEASLSPWLGLVVSQVLFIGGKLVLENSPGLVMVRHFVHVPSLATSINKQMDKPDLCTHKFNPRFNTKMAEKATSFECMLC